MPALAPRGKFLVVGVGKAPLTVAPGFLVSGERVLEGSDQGYWDWNLKTNDFRVSARFETMLGYAPEYRIRDGLKLAMPWYIQQQ